MIFAFKIQVE